MTKSKIYRTNQRQATHWGGQFVHTMHSLAAPGQNQPLKYNYKKKYSPTVSVSTLSLMQVQLTTAKTGIYPNELCLGHSKLCQTKSHITHTCMYTRQQSGCIKIDAQSQDQAYIPRRDLKLSSAHQLSRYLINTVLANSQERSSSRY